MEKKKVGVKKKWGRKKEIRKKVVVKKSVGKNVGTNYNKEQFLNTYVQKKCKS